MDWQNQYESNITPEEYNSDEPEIEEINTVSADSSAPAAPVADSLHTSQGQETAPIVSTPTPCEAPAAPHTAPEASYTTPPYTAPNAYAVPPVYAQPPKPQKTKKPKKQHIGLKVAAVALTCAILGSIGGGSLVAYLMRDTMHTSSAQTTAQKNPQEDRKVVTNPEFQAMLTSNPTDGSMTPAQVYANYVDSVVGITNESTVTNYYGQISSTASSGSGFVITEDGYIVTNYHVIEGANTLTVTLHNGDSYDAEVVGYDASNDVALLKIAATGLTVAPLGDSDDLVVGDAVAAIGNPLGELDFSMAVGYISSLDRVINTDGSPINMLQTDTAINPGNSGGPLFDMHGNVIGITTAKYSGSTTSGASIEGLGFAIPINDVKAIISDLQQYGYVVGQPYIGITVGDISSSYMTYYEYPSSAYIDSVVSGSSGEAAGLQRGDIITGLGDFEVASYTDFVVALKNFSAGDTTTITVFRNERKVVLDITFDEKVPTTTQTDDTTTQEESQIPGFGWGDLFP